LIETMGAYTDVERWCLCGTGRGHSLISSMMSLQVSSWSVAIATVD
jgi:hypothetical protein